MSKIEQVIFNYLDKEIISVKEDSNYYYFIDKKNTNYSVIKYSKESKTCYIYYKLLWEIVNFFSLESNQSFDSFLIKYVESNIPVKISCVLPWSDRIP